MKGHTDVHPVCEQQCCALADYKHLQCSAAANTADDSRDRHTRTESIMTLS